MLLDSDVAGANVEKMKRMDFTEDDGWPGWQEEGEMKEENKVLKMVLPGVFVLLFLLIMLA